MYIGKIKNTLQDWFIPTYLLGFGCLRTYYYARNSFGNISKGFINEVRTKRRKYVQEIEAMEVLKSYDSRLLNHSLQLLKMNVPNCRALHMQPK
jgi:hypothetical protein